MDLAARTRWVCEQARALGFDLCGIAPAEAFAELANYSEWLERGYAGEMDYLRDARRNDPRAVLDGARSLIVVALNYNSAQPYSTDQAAVPSDDSPRGWISRYAWGDDYHDVLRDKLNALMARMHAEWPEPFEARAYVDTGPIVERVAAKYAGLGWLAKNTCLINEELGSWVFLGVIITTLELAPSLAAGEPSAADLCGNCRLCLDACPTQAFAAPYVLDARRCISYLTIELRGAIPEELRPEMGNAVIGCDICQDVCPWNRKSPVTQLAAFQPRRFDAKSENGKEKMANAATLFAPELEWLAASPRKNSARFLAAAPSSARNGVAWCATPASRSGILGAELEFTCARNCVARTPCRISGRNIAEHARWRWEKLAAPAQQVGVDRDLNQG